MMAWWPAPVAVDTAIAVMANRLALLLLLLMMMMMIVRHHGGQQRERAAVARERAPLLGAIGAAFRGGGRPPKNHLSRSKWQYMRCSWGCPS